MNDLVELIFLTKQNAMRILVLVYLTGLFMPASGQNDSFPLNSFSDSLSYALGMNVAHSLQKENIGELNIPVLTEALSRYYGNPSDSTMAMGIDTALAIIMKTYTSHKQDQAATRLRESQTFLSNYRQDPEVRYMSEGVYYRVIHSGRGLQPEQNDNVLLEFTGRLYNGTVFDMSSNYGADMIEIAIEELIPGLQEVVPSMSVGDTWEVVVAPEKGYGFKSTNLVPSHSALIFELTLRGITRP